jgi:hypothetical protein
VADYDLLVAPPHFSLPERDNVMRLRLPLTRRRSLATGAAVHGATIPVPKPWFTILVGGTVKQFTASKQVLTEAARRAQLAAHRHGGSVVISTSRRTPPALLAAVESVLDRPYIYRWSTNGKTTNPYETLLRESAALFVTADSASMILDCCASGTPTYVIEYPERLDFGPRMRRAMFRHLRAMIDLFHDWGLEKAGDCLDRAQEWLHARRILRYPRDLRQIHASVYGMGLAHPLSEFDPATLPESRRSAEDLIELSGARAVAARCQALLQPSVLAAE